uniref:Uncharacterized protein n=1 Tax=Xenopus tropicalis TaxID=8364 RepID=A0A1B8XUX2_XENTR
MNVKHVQLIHVAQCMVELFDYICRDCIKLRTNWFVSCIISFSTQNTKLASEFHISSHKLPRNVTYCILYWQCCHICHYYYYYYYYFTSDFM